MKPILSAGIMLGVAAGIWMFINGFAGLYKNPGTAWVFPVVATVIEIAVIVWGLRKTAELGRRYGGQVLAGLLIARVVGQTKTRREGGRRRGSWFVFTGDRARYTELILHVAVNEEAWPRRQRLQAGRHQLDRCADPRIQDDLCAACGSERGPKDRREQIDRLLPGYADDPIELERDEFGLRCA